MCTILISGAGIAGPALAHFLLKRGFTPVLIDRAPRFREGGYVIDFWGVGYDVAERMGILPELRRTGYVMNRVEFVAADGKRRSGFGGGLLERALHGRFLSLPRGDLARAIYRTIENEVETIFGDSITGIAQHPDRVDVTFERGLPRTFDLVMGADGLHSAVRSILLGPTEKFERYLGFYAASFLTLGYPRRDEQTYLSYAAPGRQISRYALREDRTAFLCVFTSRERIPSADLAAQKQILRKTFSREPWIEWPDIEPRLAAVDELYFDAVSQIALPSWSLGRAALLGDAAFCPSLLSGEGAGLAMAGAYILAGELGRAQGDHARAFAAYESAFRPFIDGKQKSARAFASSFTPKTSFGLFVRDQVLKLGAIPAVGNLLMRQFVTDRFMLPE